MTAVSTTFSPNCIANNAAASNSSHNNCISPSKNNSSASFLQQQQQPAELQNLPLTDASYFTDNSASLQSPGESLGGLDARNQANHPQQQQLGVHSPLLPASQASPSISTQNLAKEWLEMFYNYNNYRYQQFPLSGANQTPSFTNKVGSNVIPNYPVSTFGPGLIPPIGHWAMGMGAKTAPFAGVRLEGDPNREVANPELGSFITPPRAEKYTIENLLDRVPEAKNRENIVKSVSNNKNEDTTFLDHQGMVQPNMSNDMALNEQGLYSKKGSTNLEVTPFNTNAPMQQHSSLLGHPQTAAASLMLTHQAALMRHWQQQQQQQQSIHVNNNTNKTIRNEQDNNKASNKGKQDAK